MSARSALLLCAVVLLGGCNVTTELGLPCTLVRKPNATDPNPQAKFIAMKEKELQPNQDFISFGAVECEDLICVRDASIAPSDNPELEAKGYCSKSCVEGSSKSCDVTSSDVPKDLRDRLTCRAMMLDQATLDALRIADETAYRRIFGENTSTFFCAAAVPTTQTP
ncbi:gliding motility protein [Corallococcus sp. H22C18031201]|uniref:adventurous gliding motility lipoprotein CglC n=1 Tax=Citreicoccus inhibens TaxID=2849499 RepID=UPI000E74C0CE|nr:adventurous gliding motility lipoprotein CglC [Citreicoccus inhibens]MBU8894912.1 adventurous gliding motility lipoprotein CglC [Citreicoccus inhibens]RJS27077.1 gliding motility protein [Corallococcus sp. H22C18031201]